MLHRQIPFLRLYVPLCAGIAASFLLKRDFPVLPALPGSLAVLMILTFLYSQRHENAAFGIVISFILFATGFLSATYERISLSRLEQKETVLLAVIMDFPLEKEKTYMIKADLKGILCDTTIKRVKGHIIIYHEKSDTTAANLIPGDILVFSCIPAEIKNRGNPGEFDYRFYMQTKGYRYCAFTKRYDLISVSVPARRSLSEQALIFREKIIRLYIKNGLKGNNLALAAAITLGEKDLLDEDQKEDFSRAGVMHVMAVSGLHAGILSFFVLNTLFFLRKKLNLLRLLITLTVLWLFAFTAGLTPSVLRASMMFSFLHTGQMLKRKTHPVNLLLASAFILTIAKPSVIFDASFQLSYLAVLFILLFYNGLYNSISFSSPVAGKIWQMTSLSLAAQAGTLPLTLMMFNRLPVLFIFSNLVIIPLAAVMVITGFLTIVTSPFGFVSSLFTFTMEKATVLSGFLTAKTSRLTFAAIENIGFPATECMVLVVFLALIMYFLWGKKKISPVFPLGALLLFISVSTGRRIITANNNELIVYSTRGEPLIGVRTGMTLYFFCAGDVIPEEVKRHSAMFGLQIKGTDYRGKLPLLIKAGNRNIIIAEQGKVEIKNESVDILVFTSERPAHETYFNRAGEIIFINASFIKNIQLNTDKDSGTGYWFVRKSGCRRIKLD